MFLPWKGGLGRLSHDKCIATKPSVLRACAPSFIPGALFHITGDGALSLSCWQVHSEFNVPTLHNKSIISNFMDHKSTEPSTCQPVLNFIYFNARSIRSKLTDLHDLLYSTTPNKIVCITETWLSQEFSSALIDPNQKFLIYRTDRNRKSPSGGVCIMVEKKLKSAKIEVNSSGLFDDVEMVACSLMLGSFTMHISCVYLAPNLTPEDFVIGINCLNSFYNSNVPQVTVGDFNQSKIDWNNMTSPTDIKCEALLEFCQSNGLSQLVTESTRDRNILDLVFTNDSQMISTLHITEPFSTSDHNSISFQICCPVQNVEVTSSENDVIEYLNWNRANWDHFASYCDSLDWVTLLSTLHSADECWEMFLEIINKGIKQFVPKVCRRIGTKPAPDPALRKLTNKKSRLWRLKKSRPSKCADDRYKLAAKSVRSFLFNQAINIEHEIINSNDNNKFFKYLKKSLSHNSGIAPIKLLNGDFATSNLDKANSLNAHFAKMGTRDNGSLPILSAETMVTDGCLELVYFDEADIFAYCVKLKNKVSSGPDCIPSLLYKRLALNLARPLSMIFNLIVQLGTLPSVWKSALVTPIFKKGVSSDAGNYRPISLTCVASKIFEKGIKREIMKHLDNHNILFPSQHGFREKHSTCSNLLEAVGDWTRNIDNRYGTLVAYIDFQKAFDKVSFPKLIYKLKHIGIKGKVLDCISSFLYDRTQRVKVDGVISQEVSLISGVPQGSVLGPVLFIIYVNDIVKQQPIGAISKLYADDLKSYTVVHDSADLKDIKLFVDTLAHINEWSLDWQLPVAGHKCQWMLFSNKNTLVDHRGLFCLGPDVLAETTETIDLGLLFTKTLSFQKHIVGVCSKAKSLIFLLRKRFLSKNSHYLILAYKSYILPILNYCSPVWSPSTACDISRLESVQKMFTKRLVGYEDLSYKERLCKSGLKSLELTRLHTDLILCYKILHNLIIIDAKQMFDFDAYCGPRSHGLSLRAPKVRTDLGLNSFSYRTSRVWNKLSPNTVWAPTLNAFKSSLCLEDLSESLTSEYDIFS